MTGVFIRVERDSKWQPIEFEYLTEEEQLPSEDTRPAGRRMGSGRRSRIRKMLCNEQRGFCAYCGRKVRRRNMQIEHMVPRALDGTDHRDNLVGVCKPCNDAKGDMPLDEWFQLRGEPQDPRARRLMVAALLTTKDTP